VVVADRGGDDAGRAAVVADLVVAELVALDLDALAALVATCAPRWSPSR